MKQNVKFVETINVKRVLPKVYIGIFQTFTTQIQKYQSKKIQVNIVETLCWSLVVQRPSIKLKQIKIISIERKTR